MTIKFKNESLNEHRIREYIGDNITENWLLEDIRKNPKNKNSGYGMYNNPEYSFSIRHAKTGVVSKTIYLKRYSMGRYRVAINNGQSTILDISKTDIFTIIKTFVKKENCIRVAYDTKYGEDINKRFGNIF